MRKSVAMLLLITLIGSLFASLPISSSKEMEATNAALDGGEVKADEAFSVETDLPGISEDSGYLESGKIIKTVRAGPDMDEGGLFESSILEVFEGLKDRIGEGAGGQRGAVNTTTLLYIREAPKKVQFGETFEFSGELLEDNNSDGERNAGDYPIIKEWIHVIWNDGSEYRVEADLLTQWDNQPENMTAGRWNITIIANETNIYANPIEFHIQYKGVWTVNGCEFYNLTDEIFLTLADKVKGYDDDGDANEMQNDGRDNDNDGVVDDGRQDQFGNIIIPVEGTPEGVDEEFLDGLDNDGDGKIDEDTDAFIAREGSEKRLYVEIWHNTKVEAAIDRDLISVGDEFNVYGTIEDLSVPETTMGQKTLRLLLDGHKVADTVAKPSAGAYLSEYKFTYKIPYSTSAGPHQLTVEFSPAFNHSTNYYWNPSDTNLTVHVRRPTMVIFDNVDELGRTNVYRGHTIWINGSIVDKYMYQDMAIGGGPRLGIGGQEYGNSYTFDVMWDENGPYERRFVRKFLTDDNGTFSIEYELPTSQDLGTVVVSVQTTFNQERVHDPLIYYTNSHNETIFIVRSRTHLDLWIDQNNNGVDDERDQDDSGQPLETFITRKPFKGADGKLNRWNFARIRGVLKDMEKSIGSHIEGVPNKDINFKWGWGESWMISKDLTTDQDGYFTLDLFIPEDHPLGFVRVFAGFSPDLHNDYYDPCSYQDIDGQPFSVVSHTSMEINATIAVKGRTVNIWGKLLDDNGAGVGNRTVALYRLDNWDGNPNVLSRKGYGTFMGSVVTNAVGKFTFKDHIIDKTTPVGKIHVMAKFAGSEEFPNGPGDVRYNKNDAFMPTLTYQPADFVITTETVIKLSEKGVPSIFTRGGGARITGNLYESYQGERGDYGVGGQTVIAYIRQGDELFEIGKDRTRKDPEFHGYFEIKVEKVPYQLKVGPVDVIVEFKPEVDVDGRSLYLESDNITHSEIWSPTRVEKIMFRPIDVDSDGRKDLYEDKINDWIFSFKVLEGSAHQVEGEPVPFGVIWFNVTMGAYKNVTRGITDQRGKITFNFTARFTDTATGAQFVIPADQDSANMTISITFEGKKYYRGSFDDEICEYHRAVPPEDVPIRYDLLILLIAVILIIAGVALFFFYKYIEKKRRLKALKKIIKKAADQLETGNPYSAVIFKSYQKLGAHLRRYGFMRRDADTFREFEDAVRTALPIDEKGMDSFLDLLEEARYSKHVIGEEHRDKAISCLRSVESSLDSIMIDEEAALRQMELADEEYIDTDIIVTDGKGA